MPVYFVFPGLYALRRALGKHTHPSDIQVMGTEAVYLHDFQQASNDVTLTAMREAAVDVPKRLYALRRALGKHTQPSDIQVMGTEAVYLHDFQQASNDVTLTAMREAAVDVPKTDTLGSFKKLLDEILGSISY
ncbi:UNVERIFIED_CONTAM: hypothetical protein FKN15_050938 [Acipenser sinensis]